jgi:hypothetical protein
MVRKADTSNRYAVPVSQPTRASQNAPWASGANGLSDFFDTDPKSKQQKDVWTRVLRRR